VAKAKKADKASKGSGVKKVSGGVKKVASSTKKVLKSEVDLPIPEPKGKKGKFFTKKRYVRMPKYFRDSWREVKKVTWPTRKNALKMTTSVVIFTVVFALFTSIVDYGFNQLVERIFL
jgi:preprotein translocase subunit SecE